MENSRINKLKEEVVVLTRENEELKGTLKKAEKDLSVAKKGEEKSKDSCKTAQRLASSLRKKHLVANTAVQPAQTNVVSSRNRSVSAVEVFCEKLASYIEDLKETVDKFVRKASQSVEKETGKLGSALSTLDNHIRRSDSA